MPHYTLYYFNHRGRAEICRMLFAVAGVPYNDKKIDFSEWINFRKNMASNMMPVLEVEKHQIPQSMTISRYLARDFGFHGRNNLEMARVESITDCLYDLFDDHIRLFHEMDGRLMLSKDSMVHHKSNSDMRQKYETTCNKVLPYLENLLSLQNGGNQFFLGDKMMLCDLMCFAALENPLTENPSMLDDYPKLQGLRNRIARHPKIFNYIKRRDAYAS